MNILMPPSFATKRGKRTFDHPWHKAQGSGWHEMFEQISHKPLFEHRIVPWIGLPKVLQAVLDDMDRMGKAQTVGVQICRKGGLMHQVTNGVMGHEHPVHLLVAPSHRSRAQRLQCKALVRFVFIDDQLNFPTLMVEIHQRLCTDLFWVQDRRHQTLYLMKLWQVCIDDLIGKDCVT